MKISEVSADMNCNITSVIYRILNKDNVYILYTSLVYLTKTFYYTMIYNSIAYYCVTSRI